MESSIGEDSSVNQSNHTILKEYDVIILERIKQLQELTERIGLQLQQFENIDLNQVSLNQSLLQQVQNEQVLLNQRVADLSQSLERMMNLNFAYQQQSTLSLNQLQVRQLISELINAHSS